MMHNVWCIYYDDDDIMCYFCCLVIIWLSYDWISIDLLVDVLVYVWCDDGDSDHYLECVSCMHASIIISYSFIPLNNYHELHY